MKKVLLLLLMINGAVAFAQNSCEEAVAVTAGIHAVGTIDGIEPAPVCSTNGNGATFGEWYVYTAAEDVTITVSSDLEINVADTLASNDTRLQLYSGACDALMCIGGDDDGGVLGPNGYYSIATVSVLAGTVVTIGWDNRWNGNGFSFEITESEFVEPPITYDFLITETPGFGSSLGLVDMNGDFLDDVVRVSNEAGIVLGYQVADSAFEVAAILNEPAQYFPGWSLSAGDLDGNGFNDLVYGAGNGVSFMYANEDGTDYSEVSGPQYVFSQRGNCVDINNDGHLDAFMCHDVAPNVYYINDGEGNLEFVQGGLGDVDGGNYGSIWVDYDSDGDSDLFIAKCSGGSSPHKQNEMHRNNGDGTYTDVSVELDLFDPVQTWSTAWGDYDNDGDLDLFIGVSSFGDGGHKLMRNDGDGVFVDVTEGSGFENFNGTGIENVTHDFDNDGYLDILGLGNSLMLNNGDMSFTFVESNVNNGAVGDVNDDGSLDVLNGGQLKLGVPNGNNYLKFNIVGTVSNINGIGAMLHMYADGQVQTREVRSGDGFEYMSSLNVHFGLGEITEVDSVVITWPSGTIDVITDLPSNTTYMVVEGQGGVNGIEDRKLENFSVYPNPATDVINFDISEQVNTMNYQVFDINGKLVLQGNTVTKSLNISELESGSYIIQIDVNGLKGEQTIVKL